MTRPANVLLTAACLAALAGCVENEDTSRSRGSGPRYEDNRSSPPPRYDDRWDNPRYDEHSHGGGSWYDDHKYDDDRGYERDSRSRDQRANANVPKGAREAAVGRGVVSYRVPTDGRVWITDSEFDAVMWSGRVYKGELIEIVPKRDRVFVDRRELLKAKMKDDIRYRIFWDRDRF